MRQEAWEQHCKSDRATSKDGILDYAYNGTVMCIFARENMITTITFPTDPPEKVIDVANGNPAAFALTDPLHANIPPNYITIRPTIVGADTTINVTTDRGLLYSFYVASYPFDLTGMTDVIVRLHHEAPKPTTPTLASDITPTDRPDGHPLDDAGTKTTTSPPHIPWDLNAPPAPRPYQDHPNDPSNGPIVQLVLKTPDPKSIARAPLGVWRNNYFTFVDFGARLPFVSVPVAAQVLPDGTERLVQWRWEGSRLVLTGIGKFVLRSGSDIYCISDPAPPTKANAS